MGKSIIIILVLFFFYIITSYSQTITLAAAANTRFATEEIVGIYEEETGNTINLVFSSSGKLTAQIMNGAPYEVFLSANKMYPQKLFEQGMTSDTPRVIMKSTLILCKLKNKNIDDIEDYLLNKATKTVAIANPKTAPYGIAAVEFLKSLGLYDNIAKKLVIVESIAQVNQHIYLNTVDAALTSKSLIFSDRLKKEIDWIEVDTSLYNPIIHFIVPLNASKEKEKQVKDLIEFLYSKSAQQIFLNFGYLPIKKVSQ